jgi:hypothetical protein
MPQPMQGATPAQQHSPLQQQGISRPDVSELAALLDAFSLHTEQVREANVMHILIAIMSEPAC